MEIMKNIMKITRKVTIKKSWLERNRKITYRIETENGGDETWKMSHFNQKILEVEEKEYCNI